MNPDSTGASARCNPYSAADPTIRRSIAQRAADEPDDWRKRISCGDDDSESDDSGAIAIADDDDDRERDDDEDCNKSTTSFSSPAPSRSSSSNNHSEIEKRRRDKMNNFIMEISQLVPTCATTGGGGTATSQSSSKKLDKLTVLRLAVHHIRNIDSSESNASAPHRHLPKCLSLHELIELCEKVSNGFVTITDLDTGTIELVSDTGCCETCTGWTAASLRTRNWFDILHPTDVATFKHHLMSASTAFAHVGDDANNYHKSSRHDPISSSSCWHPPDVWSSGAKRCFQCRIRLNPASVLAAGTKDTCYTTIRCYAFVSATTGVRTSPDDVSGARCTSSMCALMLMVPVDTTIDTLLAGIGTYERHQFVIKLSIDGRISYCDETITRALGYLPQQLIAISYYDLVHEGDLLSVSDMHKSVLHATTKTGNCHRLRTSSNRFASFDTRWQLFTNPWTSKPQTIIIRHVSRHDGRIIDVEDEMSPEQSTLKQLLTSHRQVGSMQMTNRNEQQLSPVLAAARFGAAVVVDR